MTATVARVATGLVAFAFACGLAEWLSWEPWRPHLHAQLLWLPGALLMCAQLALPYRHWPACLGAALLGVALVHAGQPMVMQLPLIARMLGDLLLVTMASAALLHWHGMRPPFEDFVELGRFLLIACVLLPLAAGAWSWLVGLWSGAVPHADLLTHRFVAHSLAYLLVVPSFAGVLMQHHDADRRAAITRRLLIASAVLLGLLSVLWMSPASRGVLGPMLTLAPTAYLLGMLLELGPAVAYVASMIISLSCIYATSYGFGPLGARQGEHQVLAMQLWALGNGCVLMLLTGITEQRRSSRRALERAFGRLTELAGRMVLVQEEERTRIARDLHDDINQSLASISIQISSLKRELDAPIRSRLDDLQQELLDVSGDIRRISHELHPRVLRYTTLAASLSVLCDSHGTVDGLQLDCQVADDLILSNRQKLNLFRIAQEALHNVEKHARATNVRLSLAREGVEIVLSIEDDGNGLDERRLRSGLGLISMEERARAIGGRLRVTRAQDRGTLVQARVPLADPQPG